MVAFGQEPGVGWLFWSTEGYALQGRKSEETAMEIRNTENLEVHKDAPPLDKIVLSTMD